MALPVVTELFTFVSDELDNCTDQTYDENSDHHEFALGMVRAYQTVLNVLRTYHTDKGSPELEQEP